MFPSGQYKYAVFYAQGNRKLPTKQVQVIQFTQIADQQPGAVIVVSATASSGLPVQYSVVSGNASVNGNRITLGNTPSVITIKAVQIDNSDFTSVSAEVSFCINPTALSISTNGEIIVATA